jgi:2-octaprenyl-6-methoxyphenol hydroxylase
VTYEAREVADHPFGYGIENRALRRALLQAVLERGDVRLIAPARLEGLDRHPERIVARLADGRSIEARLVIGADGRGSTVRRLAGIAVSRTDYGQKALTFAIRHERAHRGRVHERLLPGGPLALLPLRGRMCSVTWIEPAAEADQLLALPADGLLEVLAARLEGELGALELAGVPTGYPLGALHARRYVAPRIALVGDAAHGVHPIHAQGFNMGVADIGALAELLVEARRRGLDPGSGEALVPYERRRRLDNTLLVGLTDGLNRLFSAELGILAPLRGLGLAAIDAIPPLKRLAMRRGMGLAGDPLL